MANFCRSCGTALKPDAKFCTKCGSAVAIASEAQTAIEPDAPAPGAAVAASAAAAAGSPGESFDRRRKGTVIALVVAGVAVLFGTLLLMRAGETPTATKPVTAEKAPPAATPPPRDAKPIVASRWESYTNFRYGVMIDYPADLFAIQPPPPDNAGREFTATPAGARFFIYSHANALNFSVAELQAEDVLDIGDAAAVKQNGRDWYEIVATKGAETIVRRVLLSEGGTMVHRLEIAHPKAAATAFEPVVARMVKSFRVDPAIPEKAARDAEPRAPATPATSAPPPASTSAEKPASPAQTGGLSYRRIDSIGLGFQLAGAKSKVGFAVDVPADWAVAQGADRDSLFFAGLHPGYASEIVLAFIAEPRRAGDTLERKVEEQIAQLDASSRKNVSQGSARIGLHPAILVAMPMGEFRKTFAYIEKDDHFYFVQLHAPTALYPKYAPVLERALSSIAFAE
ncbi:MAG: zinc-ribbon domain-containing protein [Bradyrhizobium sp.]